MYIKKILFTLVLAITALASIACIQQNLKEEDIDKIEVIPVEIGLSTIETIYNERIFSGVVLPKEQSVVIPKLQGQVNSINVEVGDEVKEGDTLFTIKGLAPQMGQGVPSQPQLIIEAVKASIDGIVSSVNINKGQMLSLSEPPIILVGLKELFVQINVTGDIVNKLKKDQEVEVIIDTVSKKAFEGRIVHLSPMSDQRTQLYSIVIEITNEGNIVKPGMFAEVKAKTDIIENAIVVPSNAVFYRDGKAYLYVVEDMIAIEKEVEVGLDTGVLINIKSGLDVAEEVVIKGQNFIEDGTRVEVVRGDE